MSHIVLDPASTIDGLLFGADDTTPVDVTQRIARSAPVHTVAAAIRLPNNGLAQLAEDVTNALADVSRHPVAEALLGGWRTCGVIADAARSTAADPAKTEWVRLAAHRIVSTYNPNIEIIVDGQTAHILHFEIEAHLTIESLLAKISQGRLIAAEVGRCGYSITARCEGVDLTSRTGELDPAMSIRLGSGLPLLDPPATPIRSTGNH